MPSKRPFRRAVQHTIAFGGSRPSDGGNGLEPGALERLGDGARRSHFYPGGFRLCSRVQLPRHRGGGDQRQHFFFKGCSRGNLARRGERAIAESSSRKLWRGGAGRGGGIGCGVPRHGLSEVGAASGLSPNERVGPRMQPEWPEYAGQKSSPRL